MNDDKRRRICTSAVLARGSPLADILWHADANCDDEDSDAGSPFSYEEAKQNLHEFDDVQTPYGKLVRTFEFKPNLTMEPEPITYVCPFALIWFLASKSKLFFSFLRYHGADRIAKMLWYSDKVTPGNDKRPGGGRSYIACYWTFTDFPTWFLGRHNLSWFLLAYIPNKLIVNKFGMTRLFKVFMHIFFAVDSFNFQLTGMTVSNADLSFLLKAEYDGTVADADELRALHSVKGASGNIPCMKCRNVLGRCGDYASVRAKPDDGAYHFLDPRYDKFDLHDATTFSAMVIEIEEAPTVDARKRLEQIYGINYCVDGVLFCGHCREIMKVPEKVVIDPMHSLFSSSGIAQYHVNGLLRKLVREGVSIDEIDEWCSNVKMPEAYMETSFPTTGSEKKRVNTSEDLQMIASWQ